MVGILGGVGRYQARPCVDWRINWECVRMDKPTADRMMSYLGRMIADPRLDQWAPGTVITEIRGLGDYVSDKEGVVGPLIPSIHAFNGNASCVQLIQSFDDW